MTPQEALAKKSAGAHYTPAPLAQFLARQIVASAEVSTPAVLDPAVGDGELLSAIVSALRESGRQPASVFGFDTDSTAVMAAAERLTPLVSPHELMIRQADFLEVALEKSQQASNDLFVTKAVPEADMIIANPPYVRTQVMGARLSQQIAKRFGLSGRVDLYFAFLLGIAFSLKPGGIAGVIVSNRFMTTRSGSAVRQKLRQLFHIIHVWDLGDTRLFEAAVLPALLLLRRRTTPGDEAPARFTTIYSKTTSAPTMACASPITALEQSGHVRLPGGATYHVNHGTLHLPAKLDAVWRLSSESIDNWLRVVEAHTHCTFERVGKIRVGVKTTADKVFIRRDWSNEISGCELLRPLTTHHVARRYRATPTIYQILYPHESVAGKRRPVDLAKYPQAAAYLQRHRKTLESRQYVVDSGRKWYELWVPQDPDSWRLPKLVFRDIAAKPTFWMDLDGTVVNGDCYWLAASRPDDEDMLWLAMAVANSTFIEAYYDRKFNNKLYAGRRRFMTQYVAQFPLPERLSAGARRVIALARELWKSGGNAATEALLNREVWQSFGLSFEEGIGQADL